jgi:hypothetical protein
MKMLYMEKKTSINSSRIAIAAERVIRGWRVSWRDRRGCGE